MTKQVSSKHVGPYGDVGVNSDAVKKDKLKKEIYKNDDEVDKTISKVKKDKIVNLEKIRNRNENKLKIQEYERKERERRERYERQVAEAERNERELEFERWERERAKKSKNSVWEARYKPRRPPPGYKDPHEACKQKIPTKVKEEKRQEIKALMNCIAFTPSQVNLTEKQGESAGKKETAEEMDNSVSSDTTSDITDVTPRSSSSGCSSMSKQSMCLDKNDNVDKVEGELLRKILKKESKLERENAINLEKSNSKNPEEGKKQDNQNPEQEVDKNLSEVELEEMKYLQDAFEDLDLDEETSDFASSIISGLSEERRAKCSRKNMTFSNERVREIERVNLILLQKIIKRRKLTSKPQVQPAVNRRTSAAINRSRMEEKIERENKIFAAVIGFVSTQLLAKPKSRNQTSKGKPLKMPLVIEKGETFGKGVNILSENDPDVEGSAKDSRGINSAISCCKSLKNETDKKAT